MSVILFIIILLVLIIGHEFGHFTVAKWVKMKVLEFGVGFPPKIWGKKIGDTVYSINIIPFGGFVRIFGEDTPSSEADFGSASENEKAFSNRSKVSQAAVLFAGPGMNVVLGFLAFVLAYSIGVATVAEDGASISSIQDGRVIIANVLPHSPAAEAGLATGDQLISITEDGVATPVTKPEDLAAAVHTDAPLSLLVLHAGEQKNITVTPVTGLIVSDPTKYAIGVASLLVGTKVLSIPEAIVQAGHDTVFGLRDVVVGLATLIASAFTLSASLSDISGPVGIAGLVGDASTLGAGQVLLLAAIISLNLAVINLLPFPALDGGRLAMLLIEAVRGRTIKQATVQIVNVVGFGVLIILMLVVTWNDIAKLLV